MRAIVKRRHFIDPQCVPCGTLTPLYKWLNGSRKKIAVASCPCCKAELARFRRCKLPARVRLALNPGNLTREISYSSRPSEFEIQAYLYCELRRLGYDARGEVTTKDADCRFDIVVFSGRMPVRIIEVKANIKEHRNKQLERYSAYGVKVISVCGMHEAQRLIEKVKAARQRSPLPLLVWK